MLVELVDALPAGTALDLACGTGRNAVFLAQSGWRVTAVDSSAAAIARLKKTAPQIDARVADLERGEFVIEPDSFDLICDFYYLQHDLFPAIRQGLRPGGVFAGAIHLPEAGHDSPFTLRSGELRNEFAGWKILYYSEAPQAGGKRRSARIVARRA